MPTLETTLGSSTRGIPPPRGPYRQRPARTIAVVPAFNEEPHIAGVVRGALLHVEQVMVVDDGSTDRTGTVARTSGAVVLRHARRRGKAAALRTGFRGARERGFDLVVALDGDGQHDPQDIPGLLHAIRSTGAEVAAGVRIQGRSRMPASRRIVNRLCSVLATWITGHRLLDCLCGFRAIDLGLLDRLHLSMEDFAGDAELLVRAALRGSRIEHVPVACRYGDERSHIDPVPDALDLLRLGARSLGERLRSRRIE